MRRPSPALVVACLALLVSLAGTSYATVLNVPRNSVGTPQLKRNAVKPAKLAPNAVRTAHVLNGSLLAADFKAGQLPAGAKGDRGDKGDPGPAGPAGVTGRELVNGSTPSNSTNFKTVDVQCPAGKTVIGGGARIFPPQNPGPALVAAQVFGTSTYSAGATEVVATAGNWALGATAVCANVS